MSTEVGSVRFDPGLPYRCSPQVALRPEAFGALAYHFGTRRLSFLKSQLLADVVRDLDQHESVHAALDGRGVPEAERAAHVAALAQLADAGTIEPR
ncbi:mycofactocin biosynthesis chaperone MftB [Streptomyces viridiviolaceus]